ncbi:hypothetical protein TRFO_34244 [Tritrichomonas foetus]|uniref:Uncharacterized protein n=1 Tax=Tritrichomonas foetus TaxID=1144522 RepID=A0A1J4JKZ4_9EUKA|nr:hypothetical protein TRFO_34244 [Tritrichomonas foetus]|eukprot:OHS99337.1 hypothetical protein TRFO_34244 [Tritrichomonas foetus]
MKKQRAERLYLVYRKFLSEALKPLNDGRLQNLIENCPDLIQISKEIETNGFDDFDSRVQEKKLIEKLNRLDDLIAQENGIKVDMSALEFEPIDPENVRKSIIVAAKQQEIEKLKIVLQNLNNTNDELAQEDELIKKELEKSCEKIEETNQLIQNSVYS